MSEASSRRRLLQRHHDRSDDTGQRLLQRFQDLVGVEGKAARYTFSQITATHFNLAHLFARIGGADLVLDALGRGFTDQATVVATDVADDRFVKLVATDTDGLGVNHTVQGDDGHFSGTTTDIDHHGTGRFGDRQAGTDGSSHRFVDQVDLTGTGAQCGLLDGATLNLSGTARHTHQHTRAGAEIVVVVNLLDEVLQHLLGHVEIGDHAVFHRADRGDVARGTAQHLLGGMTDSSDRFGVPALLGEWRQLRVR